jgi:hypothetical protein
MRLTKSASSNELGPLLLCRQPARKAQVVRMLSERAYRKENKEAHLGSSERPKAPVRCLHNAWMMGVSYD